LCVTRCRRDEREKAQLVLCIYSILQKMSMGSISDISVSICIEKSVFRCLFKDYIRKMYILYIKFNPPKCPVGVTVLHAVLAGVNVKP